MPVLFPIRKIVGHVEEIYHDLGPRLTVPVRKAAMMAVVANPYAGRYVEDLSSAAVELRQLGEELGARAISLIGIDRDQVDGYGKGAIVGSAGEIEHGAMWHIPGGTGMRHALGKGEAIVPSTKKIGAVGARLDVPITHLAWSYVGSHYDAMEVGVSDAPRPEELVYILVLSTGGRVHSRLAGGYSLKDRGKNGIPP